MDLLNKTRVPVKYSTDSLSHQDVNSINSTVNSNVDGINYLLQNICNINMETKDYSRTFTLEEAIKLVPETRKFLGLTIRFLEESSKGYVEYVYNGDSIDTEYWNDPNSWSLPNFPEEIDGGEW